MAFRGVNFAHLSKFNSAKSSKLIDVYENIVNKELEEAASKPSSMTFAPSSIRCDRRSWFRLRGVAPDKVSSFDSQLDFTAKIGTACHEIIQYRLYDSGMWIDVEDYLKINPIPYKYSLERNKYEVKIEITEPYPIRFACDGILLIDDEYYLLEIKSSELSSFSELCDIKPKHIDQVKCYGTLLGLKKALVLYQERQYGDVKCYEQTISELDNQYILSKMDNVIRCVEDNIAPNKLPSGDSWCTSSMCPYYAKCKQWG